MQWVPLSFQFSLFRYMWAHIMKYNPGHWKTEMFLSRSREDRSISLSINWQKQRTALLVLFHSLDFWVKWRGFSPLAFIFCEEWPQSYWVGQFMANKHNSQDGLPETFFSKPEVTNSTLIPFCGFRKLNFRARMWTVGVSKVPFPLLLFLKCPSMKQVPMHLIRFEVREGQSYISLAN